MEQQFMAISFVRDNILLTTNTFTIIKTILV